MQINSLSYSPSNGELVSRCLDGDAAAWELLVKRYARLVRAIPAKHGFSREDIEDVTQDVFMTLAKNLERIEEVEALGKWLLVTTRHRCWRLVEKRAKEQPVTENVLADAYTHQRAVGTLALLPGLSDLAELWSQRELISFGLEKIGERCKQLLYMLFLDPEQPSYDAICDVLEMAKGSIGPTRKRCLEQLRYVLEGKTDFNEF